MEPRRTLVMWLMAVLLALLLGACSGSGTFDEAIDADQILTLQGVNDLQERFYADSGSPRLTLLVSPT